MCVEIVVDGVLCENQGDLAKAVSGDLIFDGNPSNEVRDPEVCLCPVDVEKTAEKYGYLVIWEDNMYAHFIKRRHHAASSEEKK